MYLHLGWVWSTYEQSCIPDEARPRSLELSVFLSIHLTSSSKKIVDLQARRTIQHQYPCALLALVCALPLLLTKLFRTFDHGARRACLFSLR